MSDQIFERLPDNVIPCHYKLRLKPNLTDFTFKGICDAKIEVKKNTDRIIINCADLEIRTAKIIQEDDNNKETVSCNICYDKENETVIIVFPCSPPCGPATLHLEFTGILNDKMQGFYRSNYTTASGAERYAAVSQFEPTFARQCFPCWDEPALKATFDVILVVPDGLTALSNMPVKSQCVCGGLRTLKYETTPIMSTYLLAFVVGEFDYVEGHTEDGVKVRVYTPIGRHEQGSFGVEIAKKCLPYYTDYFGIPYPLKKLDLVAVPNFASGAMENWGLITFREVYVLLDEEDSTSFDRQLLTIYIGHEIAHQWFGNLVTMEWWTDLWLNEGYAQFMENLCCEQMIPDSDVWTQFLTETLFLGMDLDAKKNSHPIEVEIKHPREIQEMFDDISYSKGASLIRMLHNYIGHEAFKKGINLYLTKHQYKNTKTEDLWNAFEESSQKPIGKMMNTWTKQMGFPLLCLCMEQQGTARILTIKQERFCADGSIDKDSRWIIPINIATSTTVCEETPLMEKGCIKITVEGVQPEDWVKLNPGTMDFYRVLYTSEMLNQLDPSIRNLSLAAPDRVGILSDTFAVCQAGRQPIQLVLQLLNSYRNEVHYTVWVCIDSCISTLSNIVEYAECRDEFRRFALDIYKEVKTRVTWESSPRDGHLDALLRSLVIERLVRLGDEEVIREAKKRFTDDQTGKEPLCPDLQQACYMALLHGADSAALDQMLKHYSEQKMHSVKITIMRCLGEVTDPNLQQRILEFSLSEDVRNQDACYPIESVAWKSAGGRELAWQFFKQNIKLYQDRYLGLRILNRMIERIVENFAQPDVADEVEKFFQDNPTPGTEKSVRQSVENIRCNAVWLERDKNNLKEFLTNYDKGQNGRNGSNSRRCSD